MRPRLYLDIDGVLNSVRGDKQAVKKFPKDNELLSENLLANKRLLHKHWYPPAVKAFKYILDKVKPDIYIHSTWRNHFELNEFREFFENWELDSSLIKGIVPQYKFSSERYHNLSWHIGGDRISTKDEPRCHNYVVLDDYDMRDIFKDQNVFNGHQIHTDYKIGLTVKQAREAVRILKGESE